MSGWFGGKVWRNVWRRIPTHLQDDVQKAVRKADEVFTKESGVQDESHPQPKPAPTLPEIVEKRSRANAGRPRS